MKVETLGPSARVVTFADGTRVLVSYETPVAACLPEGLEIRSGQILEDDVFLKTAKFHSRTTSKHIAQFLSGCASARVVPQEELNRLMEAR